MSEEQSKLLVEKHVEYVKDLFRHPSYLVHFMADHLKMNALYWGLGTLFLVNKKDEFKREEVIEYVMACFDHRSGTFAAAPMHDGHMLSTLSALQILKMYDALDELTEVHVDLIVSFIHTMQLPDGSFQGDDLGEVDSRFVYNAIQSLAILGKLRSRVVEKAVIWILKCRNFDGAFGMVPGSESHAAQCFVCLGVLAMTNSLDKLKGKDTLIWWLSDRQVTNGGLNGRPEKLPDVCYSWWVLSSLAMLGALNSITESKLKDFILSCQDPEKGGISDRPGKEVDVYHTFFGIAGLSLLGYPGLEKIDPIYCLPCDIADTIEKYPYAESPSP